MGKFLMRFSRSWARLPFRDQRKLGILPRSPMLKNHGTESVNNKIPSAHEYKKVYFLEYHILFFAIRVFGLKQGVVKWG